jgi:hypothetical protein
MRSVQRGGFNMRTGLAVAALGIIVTAGGMMLAAPVRAGQDRPGQIGQARVFVENTGKDQAVPVALQDAAINVQVVGNPTVAFAPTAVVQARVIRQAWEYRTVRIPAGQDAAVALSAAGADGWEAMGIQPADAAGIVIVLKRPR